MTYEYQKQGGLIVLVVDTNDSEWGTAMIASEENVNHSPVSLRRLKYIERIPVILAVQRRTTLSKDQRGSA